uniref:Glycosyl transferase n=1 Tax=Chlorobium chlorochromatii (strain CaD3) TaxID=340177 RepID=Q3ARK7_CHLCH
MIFSYQPTVSIILATFNRAHYVAHAVQSVVEQTIDDWELLIVDDGSDDATFDVVAPFLAQHSNIRYMKHKNRNAALSRNAGIQASFGQYITFLDSDDRYAPNHLASRLKIMAENPAVDLLSGGFWCEEPTLVKDRDNPKRLINIRECIVCGTLFGKRELFFDLEGFRNVAYAEDTDLWERASLRFVTKKIAAPESYLYQRALDSITLTYQATMNG